MQDPLEVPWQGPFISTAGGFPVAGGSMEIPPMQRDAVLFLCKSPWLGTAQRSTWIPKTYGRALIGPWMPALMIPGKELSCTAAKATTVPSATLHGEIHQAIWSKLARCYSSPTGVLWRESFEEGLSLLAFGSPVTQCGQDYLKGLLPSQALEVLSWVLTSKSLGTDHGFPGQGTSRSDQILRILSRRCAVLTLQWKASLHEMTGCHVWLLGTTFKSIEKSGHNSGSSLWNVIHSGQTRSL